MAGHSKWANIKHRKGREDAKRAKIFTKLIREITVAARGGEDLSMNPALRLAVEKANQSNMPKDTINRAIAKGAGLTGGADMTATKYEGYGPAAIAVWVHCLTDNKNRTVAEVRHAFSKTGGNLGTEGSVSFQFQHKGLIHLAKTKSEEEVLELVLEAGADDMLVHADSFEVQTSPEAYEAVCQQLSELEVLNKELTFVADNYIDLDNEQAEKVIKLVDMLEDLDDVQEVFTNANFPDA